MISHSTHHKEAFKDTWKDSAKKEARITKLIELWTGQPPIAMGFGAGSSEYIKGSSGAAGYEKAAPDFRIPGTNVVVEVTGPLRQISEHEPLLVNTHKVVYARAHPELSYWVAHFNGCEPFSLIRMIEIGTEFEQDVSTGFIKQTQFASRGVNLSFWAIPWHLPCVKSLSHFRNIIMNPI